MDKIKQNIAIAEICGWTKVEIDSGEPWGIDPSPVAHQDECGTWIPDYCNDLNAIHEAEQVLTEEQRKAYEYTLVGINRTASQVEDSAQLRYTRSSTYATAAQRAEAFLRVHGKWEEGK